MRNFTSARKRKFKKQMIVWSVGIFVLVPLGMIIFPYLINMPLGKYGSSILDIFIKGGFYILFLIWLLGVISSFIANAFNPLSPDEISSLNENKSYNNSDSASGRDS